MNRIRINILLLLLCIFIPGVAQNVSDGWNKNRTARLTKPVFVYNNWSAYDELSDNIPLDEALAMKELDHIVRLKKLGVDRKSTRLNSSHRSQSRMPSSA